MGNKETGQPLSQGRAQAPPAILALDWLLTKVAALGLRKSSFSDTWIVVVRRVFLAGRVQAQNWSTVLLPSCLFHCQGPFWSAGHFMGSNSGQGEGAEAGNGGGTALASGLLVPLALGRFSPSSTSDLKKQKVCELPKPT